MFFFCQKICFGDSIVVVIATFSAIVADIFILILKQMFIVHGLVYISIVIFSFHFHLCRLCLAWLHFYFIVWFQAYFILSCLVFTLPTFMFMLVCILNTMFMLILILFSFLLFQFILLYFIWCSYLFSFQFIISRLMSTFTLILVLFVVYFISIISYIYPFQIILLFSYFHPHFIFIYVLIFIVFTFLYVCLSFKVIQLLPQIPPPCLLFRPCLRIVLVCCALFVGRGVLSVAWSSDRKQNQGSGVQKCENNKN